MVPKPMWLQLITSHLFSKENVLFSFIIFFHLLYLTIKLDNIDCSTLSSWVRNLDCLIVDTINQ